VLPEVSLTIEEIDGSTLDTLRGFKSRKRKDMGLYTSAANKSQKSAHTATASSDAEVSVKKGSKQAHKRVAKERKDMGRNVRTFRVTCKDNGGGMPHAKIPRMLGVVLSSTKYGVKQTRGKFGLGAKMALVWAKKSTGTLQGVCLNHHPNLDPAELSEFKSELKI
jgi:DNA topoisomerase-6 subunit B